MSAETPSFPKPTEDQELRGEGGRGILGPAPGMYKWQVCLGAFLGIEMNPQLDLVEDTVKKGLTISSWAAAKFQHSNSAPNSTIHPALIVWSLAHKARAHRTSRGRVDVLTVGRCGAVGDAQAKEEKGKQAVNSRSSPVFP